MGQIVDISEVLLRLGLSSSVTEEERAIVGAALQEAEGEVKRHLRYDPAQASRTEFYPQQMIGASSREGAWESTNTEAYIRRVSESATSELFVRHLPIRSSPAIDLRIDYDGKAGAKTGAFAVTTKKVEGTDFWPNYDMLDSDGHGVCRDGIVRSIGLWPTEAGSVKIAYTAGYTDSELHGQDTMIDASPIMGAIIGEAIRRAKIIFTNMKTSRGWAAGNLNSESLGDYSYSTDGSGAGVTLSNATLLGTTKEKLADFVNWGFSLGG